MELHKTNCLLNVVIVTLLFGTVVHAADSNVAPPQASKAAAAAKDGPQIQFSELVHDFGKVDSGALVKYTYVFTNAGNATLEITGVKPGCGCTTTADWDKRVEPGKTGSIPIQFNSGGYGGEVHKTVTVSCNDPAHAEVILQLKGNVWKPIDVNPIMATFTPGPDSLSNETRVVKIVNNLEEPVMLSDLQSTNPAIRAELKTIREGKEFELSVTALAPFQTQHIWSPIILKTSTSRMPTITVNCYLNVQPAMAAIPSQITLPAGPLTNAPIFSLTIRNNTTNLVSLSEPAINAAGAEVKLAEVQKGRVFNLTATFPEGFQSQPGQPLEVSVKSDNPRYPVVKIPIIQMPSPGGGAQPAATRTAPTPGATQSSAQPAAPANPTPLASH
jgi:hypothetical protein